MIEPVFVNTRSLSYTQLLTSVFFFFLSLFDNEFTVFVCFKPRSIWTLLDTVCSIKSFTVMVNRFHFLITLQFKMLVWFYRNISVYEYCLISTTIHCPYLRCTTSLDCPYLRCTTSLDCPYLRCTTSLDVWRVVNERAQSTVDEDADTTCTPFHSTYILCLVEW